MTMQDKKVYDSISSAFSCFQDLAKCDLRKNWKKLSAKDKYNAGRALAYIGSLAKRPQDFFSWQVLDNYYKQDFINFKQNNNKSWYIVPEPRRDIIQGAQGAFVYNENLRRIFWGFCDVVQSWSVTEKYATNDYNKKKSEDVIVFSNNLSKLSDIKHSNVFVRPIKHLVYSLQR